MQLLIAMLLILSHWKIKSHFNLHFSENIKLYSEYKDFFQKQLKNLVKLVAEKRNLNYFKLPYNEGSLRLI